MSGDHHAMSGVLSLAALAAGGCNGTDVPSAGSAKATSSAAASARQADSSSSFSQYIRGVESVEDPYWGQSEQSYHYEYHWTDGSGNYRHSNDAGFNPNIGSSQNWQLMEPAG
jgi:hypothetical protein